MSAKISLPVQRPSPDRPAPAAQLSAPSVERSDFAAEVRRYRSIGKDAQPVPHRHAPVQAEFLGSGQGAGEASAAKIFNADGFFAKLEAVFAERFTAPRAGATEVAEPAAPVARPALPPGVPFKDALLDPPGPMLQAVRPNSPGLGLRHGPPMASSAATAGSPARSPVPRALTVPVELGVAGEAPVEASAPDPTGSGAARLAFRLWIEEDSVHVAGPIGFISGDEEAELIERVVDLLSGHGFSLADIRINGRVHPLPHKRKS